MSLSAMLFGSGSPIHKVTNIMGLGIPGLLHKAFTPSSPKMQPQRLGELAAQTSKEGQPRPIVYGIGRPIGGNIIYMSAPVKRMVKTYAGKAGGKGGGKKKKQYQDVEHVYRYYAVRVCEGPITGFRRIWRNGTLVLDARKGSAWGAKNNHLFFKTYRLHLGSWDQQPDTMLQARLGMDIPAFRGTAYLVADNEDLTDLGGAVPQWMFEVARSEGYYLTSKPYEVEIDDSLESVGLQPDKVRNGYPRTSYADSFSGSQPIAQSVSLRNVYNSHKLDESLSSGGLQAADVYFKKLMKKYIDQDYSLLESSGVQGVSLSFRKLSVKTTLEPESLATNTLTAESVSML